MTNSLIINVYQFYDLNTTNKCLLGETVAVIPKTAIFPYFTKIV